MSDDECDNIEMLRQRNVKEKNEFLSALMNDPTIAHTIKQINIAHDEKTKETRPKSQTRRRARTDLISKFTDTISQGRRRSPRLQKKKSNYNCPDLPAEERATSSSNLENGVSKAKRPRTISPRLPTPSKFIPVEEITENMIKNVQTSGQKVYGSNGTSCHQCRQKTVDTKTVCRSGFCRGVRGQFCGICVINRYGEDPVEALKDPDWKCYVCRGCCNCSLCRVKEGKRPTGILAPFAKMKGFKSVQDFLRSDDSKKDPENLLGFDGNTAVTSGGVKHDLNGKFHDLDIHKDILKNLKGCGSHVEPKQDPDNLLGFDGSTAVMDGAVKIEIHCFYDNLNTNQNIPEKLEAYDDYAIELKLDSENLLTFDGSTAVIGEVMKVEITCDYDNLDTYQEVIEKLEVHENHVVKPKQDPEDLLEFKESTAVTNVTVKLEPNDDYDMYNTLKKLQDGNSAGPNQDLENLLGFDGSASVMSRSVKMN